VAEYFDREARLILEPIASGSSASATDTDWSLRNRGWAMMVDILGRFHPVEAARIEKECDATQVARQMRSRWEHGRMMEEMAKRHRHG